MGESFQEGLALCSLGMERNQPPLCPRPLFSETSRSQFSAGGCGLARGSQEEGTSCAVGVFGEGKCAMRIHATESREGDTPSPLSSWPSSHLPLKWHEGHSPVGRAQHSSLGPREQRRLSLLHQLGSNRSAATFPAL